MQVRRQARIVALQVLFEVDSVHHPVGTVLGQRIADMDLPDEAQAFARTLVQGVVENRDQLDKMIMTYAPEWPIDQMAIIDRNVLRIALFEFAIYRETPPKVAINEAVELAKIFGSDSSRRFVNGVLGTFLSQHTPETLRKKKARQTSPAPKL